MHIDTHKKKEKEKKLLDVREGQELRGDALLQHHGYCW
jgi:hypothetical protein